MGFCRGSSQHWWCIISKFVISTQEKCESVSSMNVHTLNCLYKSLNHVHTTHTSFSLAFLECMNLLLGKEIIVIVAAL